MIPFSLRPFCSIMMIILSLFIIVFIKMEVRRLNYSILRQNRQYQISLNRYHKNLMNYLQMTRGARLDRLARSKLTLDHVQKGQVILIVGGGIAIPQ